ncbi:hypothetical protein [Nitrospira sp. M1]
MQKVLKQHKPIIFFEVGVGKTDFPIPQYFNILRDIGYTLYLVYITKFLGPYPYA